VTEQVIEFCFFQYTVVFIKIYFDIKLWPVNYGQFAFVQFSGFVLVSDNTLNQEISATDM